MASIPPTPQTCVFVLPQDYGHFAYTLPLSRALHQRGYAVEIWSHRSAANQIPPYATFYELATNQSFTEFYCKESSYGDDDLENILRMSTSINQLLSDAFASSGWNPMRGLMGDDERVIALKRRLRQSDVVLCVNDKCHVFSWVGDYCEKCKIPVLNLCPSQHEIQRQRAGVLSQWQSIFKNITTWVSPADYECESVRALPEGAQVPSVQGLYVTYAPLISDLSLVPPGREVIGPVYMSEEEISFQLEELAVSGLKAWLDSDPRPVVYVSLGSMVKDSSMSVNGIHVLFEALYSDPSWRVLSTVQPVKGLRKIIENSEDEHFRIRFTSWVPQFAVLHHPSVQAFVSHCGATSIHEAIYNAVPIVGIPFFDDQRYNAPRLVELGLASACLSKTRCTHDEVLSSVRVALSCSKLKQKMIAASTEAKAVNGLGRLVHESLRLIQFSVQYPVKSIG